MFRHLEFSIRGLNQHVQHNSQLADPANPYVVRMKAITSKHASKKTEKDFQDLRDLEWEGSLYLDAAQQVIVPGTIIEGALYEAGKERRQGQKVRNGIFSNGDWPLIHGGPKSLAKLKADPEFRLVVSVKNPSTRNRVMRCRPLFRSWSLRFRVSYDPAILNRDEVVEMVKLLGSKIGLSDDRRKMGGRFEVVEVIDCDEDRPSRIKARGGSGNGETTEKELEAQFSTPR